MLLLAAPILMTVGLAACSDHGRPGRGPGGDGFRQPSAIMMFSPNGEPLNGGVLGQPSCTLAINYWFDRTDANHDGHLDREEFLADARAQFAKMDLDQTGYLTSASLGRFRAPFMQGVRLPNIPDPVMAADKDVDFKVTLDEFLQYASESAAQLDANHKGVIDRADLPAFCAHQEKWGEANDSGRRPPEPGNGRGGPRGGGGAP